MEGTHMVAQATFSRPPHSSAAPGAWNHNDDHATASAIKVLDVRANRYHAGVVRAASDDALALEMPLTSRLRPGQHVRFALAHDAGIIARHDMREAVVTRVNRLDTGAGLNVELAMAAEFATA